MGHLLRPMTGIRIIALALACASLTSCAFFGWLTGSSSKESEERAGAEQVKASSEDGLGQSREEWERRIADSPWLVGGEYFRQKQDEPWMVLRLPSLKKTEEQEEKEKALEERITRLEQELGRRVEAKAANAGRRLKQKLALVGLEGEEAERLASELSRGEEVLVVEPPLVAQAVREERLAPAQASPQVALALGEALGVQLVVFVERAGAGERERSDWWLAVDLVDGVMGTVVDTLRARSLPPGIEPSGSPRADFLKSAPSLAEALRRVALEHEWAARVLSVEEGKVVIYAGRRSGLAEGDVLRVFSPGFEVVHPVTKESLGTAPGVYKGKVQVVAFVGQDAAVAKPVEGPVPSPKDIVKFEGR